MEFVYLKDLDHFLNKGFTKDVYFSELVYTSVNIGNNDSDCTGIVK